MKHVTKVRRLARERARLRAAIREALSPLKIVVNTGPPLNLRSTAARTAWILEHVAGAIAILDPAVEPRRRRIRRVKEEEAPPPA